MIGVGPNLAYQPAVSRYSSGADVEFRFAEDATLNSREGRVQLYCTRSGAAATRVNELGQLETVAADTPRLNFDPSVLRYENLLMWSEDFDNPVWTKGSASIVPNSLVAPDGTVTADKLVEDNTTGFHATSQQATVTGAGEIYTISVYAKAGERPRIRIAPSTSAGWSVTPNAVFDLVTGTVVTGPGSIDPIGDGWYLCTTVGTLATGAGVLRGVAFGPVASGTANNHQGDGASGVYIWGAQINSGPTRLAYRRTGATSLPKTYACRGLLAEESRQNKNNNINANPTVLSGTSKAGDAAATLTLVSDAAALAASGLSLICSNGNVFKLDNTAGTGPAYAQIGGVTGNTNQHTVSAYCRGIGAGRIRTNTVAGSLLALGATYIRTSHTFTPAGATEELWIRAEAGAVVYFILNQMEEGNFATSVIPISGAPATRNRDVVSVGSFGAWFNPVQGTIFCEYSNGDDVVSTRGVTLSDGTFNEVLHIVAASSGGAGAYGQAIKGGVTQATVPAATTTVANTTVKVGFAYEANNFAATRNGGAAAFDVTGEVPVGLDRAYLGAGYAGTGDTLNGHIRRFAYWRTRVSNDDLQRLSA